MASRTCATLSRLLIVVGSAALPGGVSQDMQFEGSPPLVRIDAVVTDQRGHAIQGLGVSDFEVVEHGTSRPIRRAEFRGIPRHNPLAATSIVSELDEQRAAADVGTRVFAFFLDEFHVSSGASTERVRDAVASFVDEKLFAADLAAVVTPLDSVSSIPFTRDRGLLHGPIAAFSGRKSDLAPRTVFEETHLGREPRRIIATRQQITCDRLRELALRLGHLNAERAVIVLVSEGFGASTASLKGLESQLEAVARAATRFHLTIYLFDPSIAHDDRLIGELPPGSATLARLATETGGLAVRADAFVAGFARVYHDTEAYYALAYEPLHADDAFHKVEVRPRRPDVQVRTHAGYWSTNEELWRRTVARPSSIPSEPRRPLRRSPLIDRWTGVRHGPNGDLEILVVWEPRDRSGASLGAVHLVARTETGATLFEGPVAAVAAAQTDERDHARFTVTHGRVEIEMRVAAANGAALDTDVSHMDVPDLRAAAQPGPVLLSSEIIRRRTLRRLEQASMDQDARPSAVRTFGRSDHLLIRVHAVDPTGIPVGVTARVLNRAGRPIRELKAVQHLFTDRFRQFALPLSWLPADAYHIEVLGTNANGSAAERVAFRLVN